MPRTWGPNPAYDEAVARVNKGDAKGALPPLLAARDAQPERARIYSNLGAVLRRLDRKDEAVAAAKRGCELRDPDDPYPAAVLGEILYMFDDNPGALAATDGALPCTGGSPQDRARLLVVRCWALVALGRDREAVSAGREAVSLDHSHPVASLAYAVALGRVNRWGEAMREADRALALAPGDEDAVERRATIAKGLAIAENAAATARAEVDESPKDCQRWVALGTCLTMAGRLEEAAAAFDRAHEVNPDKTDRWPDEPHLLSPWEADCRLALLSDVPRAPAGRSTRKQGALPKRAAKARQRTRASKPRR